MDIRERGGQSAGLSEEVDTSNESLIYNLVKRIDLRNQILSKFNEANEGPNSKRSLIDRKVHSYFVLAWAGLAAFYAAYRRRFDVPYLLFNLCGLVAMNEYFKKEKALGFSSEQAEEYKQIESNYRFILAYRSRDYRLVADSWLIKEVPEPSCRNYMTYRLL